MPGFDRRTGRVIGGWDHTLQSLEVIFTTRFGERVMREWFGSDVPHLLGELGNPQTFVRFYSAVARAMTVKELNGFAREPRFKIVEFKVHDLTRLGTVGIDMKGIYMPRALQGDFTPEGGPRIVTVTPNGISNAARSN
jgi:phage baseplate assembly protein W